MTIEKSQTAKVEEKNMEKNYTETYKNVGVIINNVTYMACNQSEQKTEEKNKKNNYQ